VDVSVNRCRRQISAAVSTSHLRRKCRGRDYGFSGDPEDPIRAVPERGSAPRSRPAPRLISVVLPVLDAVGTVDAQLEALAGQEYDGDWELIVSDDGSRDGTLERVRQWLPRLLHARLLDTPVGNGRGPGRARNAGARLARGDFLAFCDADDVVMPGWLSAMARGACRGDIVVGRLDPLTLNPPTIRFWRETPRWERKSPLFRFLPYASTANCGVWAEVFHRVGGFDENNFGGDKDFTWRAQLAFHRLHFAPDAVIAYRHRSTPAEAARQYYRFGQSDTWLYRRFRPAGMRRTSAMNALRAWAWTIYSLPTLPWSARRRGRWVVRTSFRCGRLIGSLRNRVLFL
jgi:glycosyltransferase involved in cell wall biosynthesis